MIYFYEDMVAQILKTVKEANDCADICRDIDRIENAVAQVKNYGDLGAANWLDHELRQKYPCIDAMIRVANAIPVSSPPTAKTYSPDEAVVENLRQDYYGILFDTAIKKGFVHSVEEFIKSVD
jgi:hypothetical protein